MARFNKQRIFNKVANHLLTQLDKCMDSGSNCQYRARGKSCAVGCLIPDSLYTPAIENNGMGVIVNVEDDNNGLPRGSGGNAPKWSAYMTEPNAESERLLRDILTEAVGAKTVEHFVFLRTLQRVHDTYPVDKWRRQLRVVADFYKLKHTEEMAY
jgi:hypothetical protein